LGKPYDNIIFVAALKDKNSKARKNNENRIKVKQQNNPENSKRNFQENVFKNEPKQ